MKFSMACNASPFLLYLFTFCLFAICRAANPTFYSIWPFENLNGISSDGSSNQAITDALNADLDNDSTKLYISQSDSLSSTWYWYAELTDDLVTKYQSFPGVSRQFLSRWPIVDFGYRFARLPYLQMVLDPSERRLLEEVIS